MAMYDAKRSGGNRLCVFEPALHARMAQRFELEQDLREALAAGDQFALVYQPLFAIASGVPTLVGFEALVRWRHPRKGWTSPDVFIPLAERSRLIHPLGDWVLAAALRQGREMQAARPRLPLRMAVNVSTIQLVKPGFCAALAGALRTAGFPPEALWLEVTETAVADDLVSRVLAEVRELGVQVAIDDFGTGYSSLARLNRLPADLVKLDRSVIEDVDGNLRGADFVGAIVALAHAAGMEVVMEGIETEDQFRLASTVRADLVQGFLFARPLPGTEAAELSARS
jgi:EAL domain-containing protein (putative c-di-GMP-specific phosphodiesterase class I)